MKTSEEGTFAVKYLSNHLDHASGKHYYLQYFNSLETKYYLVIPRNKNKTSSFELVCFCQVPGLSVHSFTPSEL